MSESLKTPKTARKMKLTLPLSSGPPVNFANIMGLGKDTHTTPEQFSYLALTFYASYLVSEPFAGYALQKLPVAKVLGCNSTIRPIAYSCSQVEAPASSAYSSGLSADPSPIVILWGLCVLLNCVAKDYATLVVLRVLLGCFEACVAPRYSTHSSLLRTPDIPESVLMGLISV